MLQSFLRRANRAKPTRFAPPSPFAKLTLQELEARDVPATWAIQLDSPASGLSGDTSASISGMLSLNSTLPTDASGRVLVEADTEQEAVALVFSGTITAQVGNSAFSYVFDPASIGSDPVAHAPFLIVDGVIYLEDMAGSGASDWDYNDRIWIFKTVIVDGAGDPGGSTTPPDGPPPTPPNSPPTIPAPALPTVWITPYANATEAGANGGFTIARSKSIGALTVTYALSGTATPVADYTGLTGSISFADGVSAVGLPFTAINDNIAESTESVIANLTSAPGYTITTGTATAWIYDYGTTGGGTSEGPEVIAYDDSYSVPLAESLAIAANGVLANDFDAQGHRLTASIVTNPTHGLISFHANGGFTYSPIQGFAGVDTFTYSASDGVASSIATVHLYCNAQIPTVEILDASKTLSAKLRIARWENAFDRGEGNPGAIKPKADFIDLDPDRFFVRVTDSTANKNANAVETVVVTIKTNYPANDHQVTLTETNANSGIFVSKSLLLTSNKVDDEFSVDGIAPNKKDDRTFKLNPLKRMVTADYAGTTSQALVALEKVVKLHITVVRLGAKADGGKPNLQYNGQEFDDETLISKYIESFVDYASSIYAPLGIEFSLVGKKIDFVDPPKVGVDLSNGLTGWTEKDGKIVLSAEEKAILDAPFRSKDKGVIEVYFINYLNTPETFDRLGEALAKSYSPDAKYADSIFIGKLNNLIQVLAHEIGHILTDDGGHSEVDNTGTKQTLLMADKMESEDKIIDSRRFTTLQATAILTKRKDLLQDPPK